MNLGSHVAGTVLFYAQNFHSDQGEVKDPTTPTARIRTPAGVWSDVDAPTKQDGQTGHYGGTIDTAGYVNGQYTIRMTGTVETAKVVATEFCFTISPAPAVPGDAMALTGAERGSIADKLLGRAIQGGADGDRTVTSALRALRNKVTRSGAVLSVKEEDDTTEAWNAALTTDAGALPVVGVDPA